MVQRRASRDNQPGGFERGVFIYLPIPFQNTYLVRRYITMRIPAVLVLVMVAALAFAGSAKKYGKPLTVKEPTKVSDILANPEKFDGKKVLVEGPVVDVCQKRGCWMRVGSEKEFESILFKVEDGVIVFPMTAKGKSARAEGIVSVTNASVEDQIEQGKHHAEETGEKFDSTSVKGPKITVRIMGEGAVIK
jgi:hypothetical protein